LPYIEQNAVYSQIDVRVHYTLNPGGQAPFQTAIKIYVCPSNPNGGSGKDTAGYGICDYMPTVYTDIDMTNGSGNGIGSRWKATPTARNGRVHGLLHNTQNINGGPVNIAGGVSITACADGTSNTIAVIEDVGRGYNGVLVGTYNDPNGTLTQIARWAEPDQGNGVSGDPLLTGNSRKVINNNATPIGGPTGCPWSSNNCGPNDEAFSFHTGGAQAVFGDGHVAFIRDSISPTAMRAYVTYDGGEVNPPE